MTHTFVSIMHFKVSDISYMFDTTHFNNMLILKLSISRIKTNYVNVGNIYLYKNSGYLHV